MIYWCASAWNRYLKISSRIELIFKTSMISVKIMLVSTKILPISIKISIVSVKISVTDILTGYFPPHSSFLVFYNILSFFGYFLKKFCWKKNHVATYRFFESTATMIFINGNDHQTNAILLASLWLLLVWSKIMFDNFLRTRNSSTIEWISLSTLLRRISSLHDLLAEQYFKIIYCSTFDKNDGFNNRFYLIFKFF